MKTNCFQRILAVLCAAAMLLCAAAAFAQVAEPGQQIPPESLAGQTLTATLKTYDAENQCFPAVFYEKDTFDKETIASLKAGDKLVLWDNEYTIESIGKSPMETMELTLDSGDEILLSEQEDGTFLAMAALDDMICMHVKGECSLKPAADIILTDASDIEAEEPTVLTGLDAILALQAQREEESIGFDYTVTTITLNENAEITEIRIDYAPWQ